METTPTLPPAEPIPLYIEAAARWCRAAMDWRTIARVGFLGMTPTRRKRVLYQSIERTAWEALHDVLAHWPGQTAGGAR